MENNMKFRNHASVILENSLKTIGTLLVIFLMNIISDIDEVGMDWEAFLWIAGLVFGALVLVLGY